MARRPAGHGLIGLTLCPGKKQSHAASGAWDRDLMLDASNLGWRDVDLAAAWPKAEIFVAGNDAGAKAQVKDLLKTFGWKAAVAVVSAVGHDRTFAMN